MLREIKCPQRGARLIPVSVDGSAVGGGALTTDGLIEGKYQVTITENSSGNYTIYFNIPFSRKPVVTGMTFTDVTTLRIVAVTTTYVQVEQVGADQTTPEADADFHLMILGFDADDQT